MKIHNINIDIEKDDIIHQISKATKIHPERLMIEENILKKIEKPITLREEKNYLFVFSDIDRLSYLNSEGVYQPLYSNSLYVENSKELEMNEECNCYLFIVHDILDQEQKDYKHIDIQQKFKHSNNIFIIRDQEILSDEFCDRLVDFIDKYVERNVEVWDEGNNVNCRSIFIDKLKDKAIKKELDDKIFNILGKVIEYLCKTYNVPPSSGDSGYTLRKIYGPTRLHIDNIYSEAINKKRHIPVRKIRNLSVIMALNGDYEGGEFYFPVQDCKIKLNKGDIIAFPPFWTHPHMVNAPSNGTYRYTVNTWLFH